MKNNFIRKIKMTHFNRYIFEKLISMQKKVILNAFIVGFTLLTSPIVIAQNEGHPLIKGFEGSVIEGQEVKEFDEQQLVIGKVQDDGSVKTVKLEGKVTKLDYRDPDNRSSLERIRNYEQAFKKAGFEIKFMCSKEECGHEIGIETIGYYPPERYLTAFQKRKEGNVWIGVFVPAGPWSKIIVVEEKPMETGMVKVTADVFKSNILKDGHAAVYGIYFDTGKSVIKPESDETIKEIAALLEANSSMQVYIIGHTDNVGKLKDNMALSQKRAEAVVNE
ncbi:MAG: OmpA family protein, partial [Ignavibacteria bacterium]|nr:OmpA family protein [Ignavibacteria bacterium]